MTFRDLWRANTRFFEADDEGAGGGDDAAAAEAAAAEAAAAAAAEAEASKGGAKKWFESADISAEERQWIDARGLAVDDPASALMKTIKGHRAAEKIIGRGVDTVLDKPKEGQALTEWMREQKDIFALPADADGYAIERPKDLAEGIAWDGEFEAAAKAKAFDLGLTSSQLQGVTELYASKVQALQQAADTTAAAANDAMMRDLTKDWGDQTSAKLALARQAAGVIGEKAGLDSAAIEAVSGVLTAKAGGDAATIRLFATLGEMMGEDMAVGLGHGDRGMTPADARQKAAQMRSPEGAYYKATQANDRAEIARLKPEMERLDRLASGK